MIKYKIINEILIISILADVAVSLIYQAEQKWINKWGKLAHSSFTLKHCSSNDQNDWSNSRFS